MGSPERFIKKCMVCFEVMPTYEKVCMCGGPIMMELVDFETFQKAKAYIKRVWLLKMKDTQ